jgi:hypothetical protein
VARDKQTREALAAQQKADIEKWWPIIKVAGIRAEYPGNHRAINNQKGRAVGGRSVQKYKRAAAGLASALLLRPTAIVPAVGAIHPSKRSRVASACRALQHIVRKVECENVLVELGLFDNILVHQCPLMPGRDVKVLARNNRPDESKGGSVGSRTILPAELFYRTGVKERAGRFV